MKFIIITIIFLCSFFYFKVSAQNSYAVKGSVIDTAAKQKLASTTVMVLNAKDSIMRAFTWAAADGSFLINNLPKGKFILLVTYPGYADYVERFSLDSVNRAHNFGAIGMILKARLLADVIIKAKVVAIKIKGDTTEYDAKAYVVQPNDKVEDLLRQLPGIQVDKDGKITAQGQTVTKVLVDGEEFFGDDPTLVTKNIGADMVDKIQLYDKKSDQAAFTGIDDGKTTKTINIKLKQDKKKGIFGKVDANQGTDGYYEGQLQFNKFEANEKIAFYGTAANDGRTGLGFQDSNNLGANSDNIQFVDGGITIFSSGQNDALDSFSGYFNGKGLPVAESAGAHFDDKWDGDKESINTNYKVGAIDVAGTTTTTSQEALPTGIINTNSNENFNDYAFRQKLDITYQIKLDTSSTLKLSTDGTFKNFNVNNDYQTSTDTGSTLINRENRSEVNHGNQQIFDITALYTKKFKKVGRTLSWSLSEAYNDNQTEGYLNSEIDYYSLGVKDSVQTTNQYKTTNTLSSVVNSNITYSEPLTTRLAMLFNYGININNTTSDNISYDESAPGLYNIFDDTYSNDYKFDQLTNQVGAILNYKYRKAIFNIGTKVSDVGYKQIDEYTGDVLQRNFIYWAPQAMYQYKFSQQHTLTVNYYGNTQAPTIAQIQPVLVNTDPLNVTLGNPDLKPAFTNRVSMFYNSYQVISGQQLFVNGSYTNTLNPIVNNTSTDETTGKSTTEYVNLGHEVPYNYFLFAEEGRTIKPIDLNVGLNINTSGNVSYSYINSALDMANSHTYSIQLNVSKYVQKKYDFYIYAGPNYTFSTMSLQPGSNNNAAGFKTYGNVDVYLPLKFGAGTNVNYTYTAQTQAFSAEYMTIWNAYIFKTFTKDDKLKVSLSVNDLLNQNINFSRGINGNTTTQTNTTGIRRFFMLSVTWDFTKFGTTSSQK